jgi:hypothetical protein
MNWKKPKKNKKKRQQMNIGGFVGSMNGGTLENCSSSGKIIFEVDFDDYVAGKLTNLNVGGIAGSAKNATFKNVQSDGKIYIRDPKKFASLEKVLSETIDNAELIKLATAELDGIKSNIGNASMGDRVERFLNIVNGVKDAVAPFVPYLMSLIP